MMDELFESDPKALALYQKGEEIIDVVMKIIELLPEDNEKLGMIRDIMMQDATTLCVKVAGAVGGDLYDIKMEAAAFIRSAANNLKIQNHALTMFGFDEAHYFTIVRDLIEEYRLLFIEWVQEFDQWNYHIDRWGLFNPPGVGPFDKDPDDDIL
jgi:hypothetical protein